MKKLFNIILMIFALGTVATMTSCSDNDGDAPQITGIRYTNPDTADSLFVNAKASELIVIVGQNLATAREIYINGESVPFQLPYVTNTHIILQIPAEIPLKATNPEVPNEIRVVTKYGEAVYSFHVNAPDGYLNSVAVDAYPVDPGTLVTLDGANLYEIQRIYYTNTDPNDPLVDPETGELIETPAPEYPIEFDITSYEVNEDYDRLTFAMPSAVDNKGWIVVDFYANTANVPIAYNPPIPQISYISSDMPITGSEFEIQGLYFIDVRKVMLGSVEVPATDLEVSEDGKSIKFIVPEFPSDYMTSMNGKLEVYTVGGIATVENFYDVNSLLIDFDDVFGWWSWGATEGVSLVIMRPGDNSPYPHSGKAYGLNYECPATWWTNDAVMNMGGIGLASSMNDIPMGELELRMEILFIEYLDIAMTINLNPNSCEKVGMLKDIHGYESYGKWAPYAIPLTDFGVDPNMTWGEYRGAADGGFQFYIRYPGYYSGTQKIELYFDNIRIHRIETEEE